MLANRPNKNPSPFKLSGPARYDLDLKQRVTTFLAARHRPALRRLDVQATAGIVTLRGHVGTFHEKQLTILLARRVAGVIRLIDEVSVRPASASAEPAVPEVSPAIAG